MEDMVCECVTVELLKLHFSFKDFASEKKNNGIETFLTNTGKQSKNKLYSFLESWHIFELGFVFQFKELFEQEMLSMILLCVLEKILDSQRNVWD
jgi:hypothetical protein